MPKVTRKGWIAVAALVVVLWRITAMLAPHTANTDPKVVRDLLALLGLWFVACGLWAAWRASGPAVDLFAAYCLAAGVHWGGPLGLGPPSAQHLLLGLYVVVSTALAQGLFLHLAMVAPTAWPSASRRGVLMLIYLPALVGAGILFAMPLRQDSAPLVGAIAVLFPIGVLWSLIAGGIWIRRWVVATAEERLDKHLGQIVAWMIGGWLPHALASAVGPVMPPYDGLFNLPMAAIPAVLTVAVVRSGEGRPRS